MPLLAQISTGVIEAASDAGVAVLALIAIIVLGFGAWRLGDRLFATVDKLTVAAQDAQEKAEDAQKAAKAAQDALSAIASAVQTSMNTNTAELKAQTAVLVELRSDLRTQIDTSGKATTSAITAHIDASDAELKTILSEVKTTLTALRDEIAEGHKAQRKETIERLDRILALLTPPAPEPKVLPHPELKVA